MPEIHITSRWRQGRVVDRRRFLRGGAAATGGMTAAFLVACSGKSSIATRSAGTVAPDTGAQGVSATPSAALPPTGSPQPAASAAKQKPVGTVTVVQSVDANTLDPAFANAVPEANINFHIFDTLLWRDPKTLKPVPWLAQAYRRVDPLTWEFTLRPNLKFHDGMPLDAEAVRFSLERNATETIGGKPTVPRPRATISYDKAEVVDATTVRIKTSAPSPVVPDVFTNNLNAGGAIVSPAAYQDQSAGNLARVAQKPVGSGPYKFVEWQKDQQMVLEVNPDWWGPAQAFERIIFKPVGEASTRILQLENGEADIIVNVPPDNAADVDKSGKARISQVNGLRKIYVGIREEKAAPLADKRVRQAMNYALNFDAINRALLNGVGKRMNTYFNAPHEPPDAKPYAYDLGKAKALLAEAGYPNGFSVEMHAPSGRYINDKEIAQAVAQDLQKAGINVALTIVEWSVYSGKELQKAAGGPPAGLYFLGLGSPVNGVNEAFWFLKDSAFDYTGWKNDQYLALYDQLKMELDETKFQAIINQMHQILWDEVPWLGIYNQVDIYGVSRRLAWDARADERIAMFEAKWKA
jgi:peptide/nickel transport system substrate-binding protein